MPNGTCERTRGSRTGRIRLPSADKLTTGILTGIAYGVSFTLLRERRTYNVLNTRHLILASRRTRPTVEKLTGDMLTGEKPTTKMTKVAENAPCNRQMRRKAHLIPTATES